MRGYWMFLGCAVLSSAIGALAVDTGDGALAGAAIMNAFSAILGLAIWIRDAL